jgi:N-acyl-D-aspartate/D-glutamate deacylase
VGFDLKITGGTIIDGTGRPGRPGDVAIDGGRVAAVGTVEGDADEVIEAQGSVVAPGFVDIHTHYDAQIIWDRALTVSPWHGVTSVVIGNCGFGVAPTRPADHDLIVKTLEKVEGMSADALRAGLGEPWPFETFPDYLDTVEERAPLINVAAMIGHTPLRLYVMGSEATSREATTDEITVMKGLVAEALEAGALGFSSSKSNTHVGYEGRPVPSRLASGDEILELAGVLGDAGRGVMQATMGSGLLFDDFAAITERTGRPLSWTALLAGIAEDWLLAESHELVDRGLPVHPQVSCRPLMFEFDLAEPFPLESSRLFADISAGDPAAKRAEAPSAARGSGR